MPAYPDALNSDAFSAAEMMAAINKPDFQPSQVRDLGLFEPVFGTTKSVEVEEKDGSLALVQTTLRSAPAVQHTHAKRIKRSLTVPRIALEDTIRADEIDGIVQFGSTTELQQLEAVRDERLADMVDSVNATEEHLMLGALKGTILDADGSTTIYNLFTEFGVSQETEVDFDFAAAAAGAVQADCSHIWRTILGNLGALSQRVQGIKAFASSGFIDTMFQNAEVRASYLNWEAASALRENNAYRRFNWGGIMWEEYRGMDDGSGAGIPANKAIFFPIVRGLYKIYYAPGDFFGAVNRRALPRYARATADPKGRCIELEVQANPLPICLRPKVLMVGNIT